MRSLTNDMAQLRSHIDDSRATRLSEHHVRITNVKSQLSDFAISRLSNGIQDARERADFVSNNKKDVKRLVSEFHHSRQTMSRQDRKDRIGFVNDISKDTLTLLADFNNEHKAMAQHTAKVRSDFIAENKSDVRAFINEASDDRAGAHAVFFGKSQAKKKNNIFSVNAPFVEKIRKLEEPSLPLTIESSVYSALHTTSEEITEPNTPQIPTKHQMFLGKKKNK